MNEKILENTIKELATKIANLEIENAQLKATIQSLNSQAKAEDIVVPKGNERSE